MASKKDKTESMFDDLIPDKGDTDLINQSNSNSLPAPEFSDLKRTKRSSGKYSSFRMRTEILSEMDKIARKEKIPFTGQLVHRILQNYVDWYKENK
tara:strand:+ start:2604 stop:2891 length:288 start_codon:yes stop_codon:yes gene_type:complete